MVRRRPVPLLPRLLSIACLVALLPACQAEEIRAREDLKEINLQSLRLAIQDLMKAFPERYPRGEEFLRELAECERRLPQIERDLVGEDPAAKKRALEEAEAIAAFQREVLIANPLVSGHPILFVARKQYKLGGHHAIDTLFHTGEINTGVFEGGGALKTIDFAKGGETRTLVELPEGIVRDPDAHFDGERIVMAIRRNIQEDYHIWEVNADGTGLRQLTCAEGVCDFDPIYLPDDHIAFSSTREPKYNQCSRDIAANLFRMEPDGANIHQIGKNNLFDNHADLLPDGRILYARWEYVDRNFGDAHGLWTVNPDGTNQAVYWGNNTASPAAVFNAHAIPGTHQVLCVFGMHHYRLWGAMAIIDRRLAIDGRPAVVRTWPSEAVNRVQAGGPFDCDGFISVYPKYADPWPLSDKYFLCSRMTMAGKQDWIEGDAAQGHEMGIYLVDVFGNEVLLHVERDPARGDLGCFDPMPLKPRPRPPAIPPRRDFDNGKGYFYVADVYQGTHMRGVRRGAVKSLRVVESPEKRAWSQGMWVGQGYTAPGMNWHSLENKRILGTVPVEEDGSAYFAAPCDKFLYFQLLDENGMMIQSMRSGTALQSGERAGCIGCHEDRLAAPLSEKARTPIALGKDPSELEGWYGEPRPFGFMAEVQPVFDAHCVQCHDYGKEAGQKLNLAPDRDVAFNTAYNELWRKRCVECVGAGPAEIQQAYSWGSHASKLVQILRGGHKDTRLSEEELDRIITWVDINAPYYASYSSAYPDSLTGRCPLDERQLGRLAELTGVPFAALRSYNANRGPEISFERPELSPCLARFSNKSDPQYREALALIRAGGDMLKARPRADMPSFAPCETDRRREEKYAARREAELRSRRAIAAGEKVYDEP